MIVHPTEPDLGYLYDVIVVDNSHGASRRTVDTEMRDGLKDSKLDELGGGGEVIVGSDTNFCFFADEQFDRSPTGSGVSARVALVDAN